MATPICSELNEGYDLSCIRNIAKGYYQDAVFINFNDLNKTGSTLGSISAAACDYSLQMLLKTGKKGVLIKLPTNGSTLKGWYDKTTTDKGIVEYSHKVQILALGVDSATKCKIDSLDHGRYVVVLKANDGNFEIFGYENGISTGDYTYDIADGGGGSIIPFQSKENQGESMLPLVYKPAEGGDAEADFESLFLSPAV